MHKVVLVMIAFDVIQVLVEAPLRRRTSVVQIIVDHIIYQVTCGIDSTSGSFQNILMLLCVIATAIC